MHAEPTLELLRHKVKTIGQFSIYLLKDSSSMFSSSVFTDYLSVFLNSVFKHPDIYIKFAAVTLRKKEQKHKQIKPKTMRYF